MEWVTDGRRHTARFVASSSTAPAFDPGLFHVRVGPEKRTTRSAAVRLDPSRPWALNSGLLLTPILKPCPVPTPRRGAGRAIGALVGRPGWGECSASRWGWRLARWLGWLGRRLGMELAGCSWRWPWHRGGDCSLGAGATEAAVRTGTALPGWTLALATAGFG